MEGRILCRVANTRVDISGKKVVPVSEMNGYATITEMGKCVGCNRDWETAYPGADPDYLMLLKNKTPDREISLCIYVAPPETPNRLVVGSPPPRV